MKMNPRTLSVLLLLAGPLGADPDWHVEYPDSFCVVEGSTATISCSFTHPAGHEKTGAVVEQVVWCPSHKYCDSSTTNVYDSSNVRADSRFLYLGDLVSDCTLKIIKTEKQDAATYHFRFETNGGGYTGLRGVSVRVTDGEDVKVRSSVTDNVVKEGGQVTLTCTSACSFHQLDVHCGKKTYAPWSLVVVESRFVWHLTVSVVLKVLWAVFLLLLAGLVFAKRSAPGPEQEIVYSEVVG
ncbi:unnamed protein product [Arctogadus glacialis]